MSLPLPALDDLTNLKETLVGLYKTPTVSANPQIRATINQLRLLMRDHIGTPIDTMDKNKSTVLPDIGDMIFNLRNIRNLCVRLESALRDAKDSE